jgi:hypothetical protein
MATILLIGPDAPLLEGLSQTLAAVGHHPLFAMTLAEGAELASQTLPLIAVIERSLALSSGDGMRIPLARGGTVVLYRPGTAAMTPLPPALQRAVLADLSLPLERHRLIALVQSVVDRAKVTGRGPHRTPPEHHAL